MGNLALAASRARQLLEENGDGVHDAHGGTELLRGDGGSCVCVCVSEKLHTRMDP